MDCIAEEADRQVPAAISEEIPIEGIVIGDRRGADPKKVEALADSIREIGLQHPIGVTEDHRLIHGLHRIEAYKLIGWATIPALIHSLDDLHVELAEIDENLLRSNLTAVQYTKALARRKKIYESLHPETKHGGASGKAGGGKKAKDDKVASFAEDTAKKTGRSVRAIQRDVAIAENLTEQAQEELKGAAVSKSELEEISKQPKAKQKAAATTIKRAKQAKKAKATTKKTTKPAPGLYEDCETPFQQMLNRVKPLGRVPEVEFYAAIGGVIGGRLFRQFIDEIHYLHILTHDDGTCELFIDETERDLCTAIHAQIERMRTAMTRQNRFKVNVDLFKKITQDLYELVRKASTHEKPKAKRRKGKPSKEAAAARKRVEEAPAA